MADEPPAKRRQTGGRAAVDTAPMVVATYQSLPKTGKPQPNEHTVLAGFVLEVPSSDGEGPKCVALGTGTKCVAGDKRSPAGDLINDSHAPEPMPQRAPCSNRRFRAPKPQPAEARDEPAAGAVHRTGSKPLACDGKIPQAGEVEAPGLQTVSLYQAETRLPDRFKLPAPEVDVVPPPDSTLGITLGNAETVPSGPHAGAGERAAGELGGACSGPRVSASWGTARRTRRMKEVFGSDYCQAWRDVLRPPSIFAAWLTKPQDLEEFVLPSAGD
eukprot:jgi/Tetstr1/425329/TSEL_015778.t1